MERIDLKPRPSTWAGIRDTFGVHRLGGFRPVAEGGAPSAAAEQVEVCAHLRERVTGRIDAIYPGERIEDDLAPFRRLIIHPRGQSDRAEGNLLAAGGPRRARVGDIIAGFRHLDK